MKNKDIQSELQNAMARELIMSADILTLLEVLASLCQKLDVDLDVWNLFRKFRSDFLQAKMTEIEDSDPSLAKILQKHINCAKRGIEKKISENDS